ATFNPHEGMTCDARPCAGHRRIICPGALTAWSEAKFGMRSGRGLADQHYAAEIGKPRLELGVGKPSVDLLVESVDDVCRCALARADAVPRTRLVAGNEIGDDRHIRKRLRTRR